MNREIKFRGKCFGDMNAWVIGYYHYDKSTNKHYIVSIDKLIRYEVMPETVGQFACLLDKSGNEIYDGDICIASSGVIGQIVFKNGRFAWTDVACHWDIIEFREIDKNDPIADELEVIGNVYENPELLNK